uniref:Uncharacterized protein n=1 Tax=Siphoviridae sp. ctqSm5 TaxID=2827949 RepID=A0A8S5SP54_9CAUD|nr:MAG TPA: hypothetical protein [Siphoviridae sp. ctqSm5]
MLVDLGGLKGGCVSNPFNSSCYSYIYLVVIVIR